MDTELVLLAQQAVNSSKDLAWLGVFCAVVLIWTMVGVVLIYWVFDYRRFLSVAAVAFSSGLAYAVNWLIGLVYFRPRPFAAIVGVHQLLTKSLLEKSFPSDHSAIAFAMAFAVFLVNKRWGAVLLVMAVLVAVGRVLVGVHYPTDILAGAAVGLLAALVVHRLIHYLIHTKHASHSAE